MKKGNAKRIKIILFLFPIICSLLFLGLKIMAPGIYRPAIQEDSIIEYMQASFYFLSSIIAFIIAIRFLYYRLVLHGILYLLLFIGLLFITNEEISWGQRILAMQTPTYFKTHNTQKEISIHNLEYIQPYLRNIYILVGLYGTFAWFLFYKIKATRINILRFIVPEWFISSYFYALLFIYICFYYISPFVLYHFGNEHFRIGAFLIWRDQEPAELLCALGFLIFTIVNYIKSRTVCLSIFKCPCLSCPR